MLEYNEQLDREFKAFGFDDGSVILATRTDFMGSVHCFKSIPAIGTWALGYDAVEFGFVIRQPDERSKNFIRYIAARSERKSGYRRWEDRSVTFWSELHPARETMASMMEKIWQLERQKILFAPAIMSSLLQQRIERMAGRPDGNQSKGLSF